MATNLAWDGYGAEWPKCAIAPDGNSYVLYAVESDGRLLIQGDGWKEPTRRDFKNVPKEYRDAWQHTAQLGTPQRAMRVAQLIQKHLEEEARHGDWRG